MKPQILGIELSLFLFCLTLHVLIWRGQRPRHQAVALALIFLIPLALLLGFASKLQGRLPGIDLAAIALLHLSLTSAYVQTYPAIQAMSPTLLILLIVQKKIFRGATEAEIASSFKRERLFGDRVQDLLAAGLVRKSKRGLEITLQGSLLVTPLVFLRGLLGLPPGGQG